MISKYANTECVAQSVLHFANAGISVVLRINLAPSEISVGQGVMELAFVEYPAERSSVWCSYYAVYSSCASLMIEVLNGDF